MKILLETLVGFWDTNAECFIIQGERLKIMLQDFYFLDGIPMLGVIGNTMPKHSDKETLDDLFKRNYYASSIV